ncbi:MAG: hypothetical protein KDE27_32325 [Planctomycetes bacterium]|nr:hypothetical protein [Planctomycetota bacterium]
MSERDELLELLQRAWDDVRAPRWPCEPECESSLEGELDTLRRAYRAITPPRPGRSRAPRRRSPRAGRPLALFRLAVVAAAALFAWRTFAAPPPARVAVATRASVHVVRADEEITEIVSGPVRLILVPPSSPSDR